MSTANEVKSVSGQLVV